ncbi:MAG: N-acetylglucosamine-6-phosphate deacetylase, partial [Proteobacteria bacterium]|nr:N-acetylglucosamine-6-phosphate deacetylase [Pseudomonadota bacterium]
MTSLWASRAITSAGPRRDVRVRIEGGLIAEVETGVAAAADDDRFPEGTLAPGLVDLQVNGALGAAYSDADPAARRRATDYHLRSGTTSLLATLISAPVPELVERIGRLARDVRSQPELAGIHLEGPFLCPEKAGAHDPAHFCDPAPERVDRLLEAAGPALAMLTLAPERSGAPEAVERLAGRGVVVAAGHSLASYERMREAAGRGLSFVTHLGNACEWPARVYDPELGYRRGEPGVVGAFLIDRRLRGSLILDGRHLPPELARALIAARGRDALA